MIDVGMRVVEGEAAALGKWIVAGRRRGQEYARRLKVSGR